MAAAASASRGALLREITIKSSDILTSHARQTSATARLDAAQSTKSKLQERIALAEAEFSELQAQKTRESENDSELVALQRAHASVTTQRQGLIRDTITARSTRDALREKLLLAHYTHCGTWLERARLASTEGVSHSALTPACVWSDDASAAFRESEALWKRSSNVSVSGVDCLHASLALHGLRVDAHAVHEGESSHFPPPSAAAYAALGAPALHADTVRCAAQLDELGRDTDALLARCEAMQAAVHAEGGASSRGDRAAATAARVHVLLMQLVAHIDAQRVVVAQAHALITAAGACTCAATVAAS